MIRPHRNHPLWWAYALHRLSGVVLCLFLPAHFYVLGLALNDPAALDGFLHWADNPLVKVSEMAVVFLLALHLLGGLRLLALEFLPWNDRQVTLAMAAACGAVTVAAGFLFRVF